MTRLFTSETFNVISALNLNITREEAFEAMLVGRLLFPFFFTVTSCQSLAVIGGLTNLDVSL
jgi:hypothetical protein